MKCAAEANEEREMWSTHCDSDREKERGRREREKGRGRGGGERQRDRVTCKQTSIVA